MGEKMGLNGIDNGYDVFCNQPKSKPNALTIVFSSPDFWCSTSTEYRGRICWIEPETSPQRVNTRVHFRTHKRCLVACLYRFLYFKLVSGYWTSCCIFLGAALENLSAGRIGICQESTNTIGAAIVIAIRYAAVRKQFGQTSTANGKEENPLIEYELHVSLGINRVSQISHNYGEEGWCRSCCSIRLKCILFNSRDGDCSPISQPRLSSGPSCRNSRKFTWKMFKNLWRVKPYPTLWVFRIDKYLNMTGKQILTV